MNTVHSILKDFRRKFNGNVIRTKISLDFRKCILFE